MADMEVTSKKDKKKAESDVVVIREKNNKAIKEMEKKSMIKSTELGVKNGEATKAIEQAAKQNVLDANENRQKDETEAAARREKFKEVENETLEAVRQRDLAVEKQKIDSKKAATEVGKAVFDL